MNPRHLGRLWRTVRHYRLSQILRRALVVAKRASWRVTGGSRIPRRDPPTLSDSPPSPVIEPTGHKNEEGGLEVLGKRVSLDPPIDWTRPGTDPASQLALFHLHYHDYLPDLSDDAARGLVLDWIASNPLKAPRVWHTAWSPYVVAVRTVAWMHLLARKPGLFDRSDHSLVVDSLVTQLRYLERNLELDLGGNHLVRDVRALVWASAFFSGPEADRWREESTHLLDRILDQQILPDGMHFERAPAYHLQVLADLIDCRAVLSETPIASRLDGILPRMAQVAVDLSHPDGLPSLMGDGGLHLAPPASTLVDALHDVTGISSPAPSPWFSYADGGYYGVRTDRLYLVADCGPIGPDHLPAHGHGDILSFELSVDGLRFIVDPGTYQYEAGPDRDWSRSTRAHNTVTLDDLDQAEFWSSFRVGRRPGEVSARIEVQNGRLVVEGSHDGYTHLVGKPLHRRGILITTDRMWVTDTIKGGAGQTARARLLLHPRVDTSLTQHGWELSTRGSTIRLVTESNARVGSAWWAPDLGRREETRQLVLEYGPVPLLGSFLLELQ